MSTQYGTLPERTAKPVVAGIFNICSGAGCVMGVLALLVIGVIFLAAGENTPAIIGVIFLLASIPLAIIGILSIVGGIYSIQRKMYSLALAGSIAAACVSTLMGITSIVLTVISKNEFSH
jgi:hypothetical protein